MSNNAASNPESNPRRNYWRIFAIGLLVYFVVFSITPALTKALDTVPRKQAAFYLEQLAIELEFLAHSVDSEYPRKNTEGDMRSLHIAALTASLSVAKTPHYLLLSPEHNYYSFADLMEFRRSRGELKEEDRKAIAAYGAKVREMISELWVQSETARSKNLDLRFKRISLTKVRELNQELDHMCWFFLEHGVLPDAGQVPEQDMKQTITDLFGEAQAEVIFEPAGEVTTRGNKSWPSGYIDATVKHNGQVLGVVTYNPYRGNIMALSGVAVEYEGDMQDSVTFELMNKMLTKLYGPDMSVKIKLIGVGPYRHYSLTYLYKNVPILTGSSFFSGTALYSDDRLSFTLPYVTARNTLFDVDIEPGISLSDAREVLENTEYFMGLNFPKLNYDETDGLIIIHSAQTDKFELAYCNRRRYVNAHTREREIAVINLRQGTSWYMSFLSPHWN